MKPEIPSPELWGDISVEEIQTHLDNNEIDKAVRLAELRLAGLNGMIKDIRTAMATAREIDPAVWEEERKGYLDEIEQLETILATYRQ